MSYTFADSPTNPTSTLSGAHAIGATSLTLATDPGTEMPSGTVNFAVLIDYGTASAEVVACTARTTTTVTCAALAKAHAAAATVDTIVSKAIADNWSQIDKAETLTGAKTLNALLTAALGIKLTGTPTAANVLDGLRRAGTNDIRAVAGAVDVVRVLPAAALVLQRLVINDGLQLAATKITAGSLGAGTLDADITAGTTNTITAASNASPIVITTSVAHARTTGDVLSVENVSGNTAANGTWTVTVLTTTTFSLDTSVGNGAYTSGGVVKPTIPLGVGEGSSFTTRGTVQIDSEYIAYGAVSGDRLVNVIRGAADTTAATHLATAAVTQVQDNHQVTVTGPSVLRVSGMGGAITIWLPRVIGVNSDPSPLDGQVFKIESTDSTYPTLAAPITVKIDNGGGTLAVIDKPLGTLEVEFDTVGTRYAIVSGFGLRGEQRVINRNTTAVGNVGVGEDDLITYSVPGNVLLADGDSITFEASGTFAANANNKRLKVKFGTDALFDTTSIAINGADWTVHGRIIRTGAATQRAYVTFASDDATLNVSADASAPTQTLSSANTLKCTGEATANDDVKQETLIVSLEPI